MDNLRKKLTRIAWELPQLRPALVGVLRERRGAEFQFISNAARTGFGMELLPQIERWVTMPELVPVVADHLRVLLTEALRDKNSLYLLLIRYKSLDASAERYFEELVMAVDEWESREQRPDVPTPALAPTPAAPVPAPMPAAVVQQPPVQAPTVLPVVVPVVPVVPAAPVAPAMPVGFIPARED